MPPCTSPEIPDNDSGGITQKLGANTTLATALAVAACVADCFEAKSPRDETFDGLSQSLRVAASTAVLVLAMSDQQESIQYPLASPETGKVTVPVVNRAPRTMPFMAFRVILCTTVVLGLALFGARESSLWTRLCEGVFVSLALPTVILPEMRFRPRLDVIGSVAEYPTRARYSRYDDGLCAVLAVLTYAGGRTLRAGLWMCRESYEYVQSPSASTSDVSRVCVACSGWGAASSTVVGATTSLCSVAILFTLSAPMRLNSIAVVRRAHGFAQMAVGIQLIATFSAMLAQSNSISYTPSTYDPNSCVIGGELDGLDTCDTQLVAFRRLGIVQSGVGCCIFTLMAMLVVARQLGKQLMNELQQEGMITEFRTTRMSGVVVGMSSCALLVIARLHYANWRPHGLIEISTIVVFLSTAFGALAPEWSSLAGASVYVGLLIDYIYYVNEAHTMRDLNYLTNVTNLLMFVFLLAWLSFYIIFVCAENTKGAIQQVADWMRVFTTCGRSLAVFLGIVVTAAFAAYDGSDISEIYTDVPTGTTDGSLGLGQQQAVLRFILWHYAPLVAWTFLQQSVSQLEQVCRIPPACNTNWLAITWFTMPFASYCLWTLYKLMTGSGSPEAYPMSNPVVTYLGGAIVFVPSWVCAFMTGQRQFSPSLNTQH